MHNWIVFLFLNRAQSICPRCIAAYKAYCATLNTPPHGLDVSISTTRRLHIHTTREILAAKRWNCGQECWLIILPKCRFNHVPFRDLLHAANLQHGTGTALLPLRRKARWGFFRPEKSWHLRPGLNPRTWVLKGSMLPLDHWSHYWIGLNTILKFT
jgi:hypothetical protein